MSSSKAAASKEARRTLRYVEPLSDARTPLPDFFSILLNVEILCFVLIRGRVSIASCDGCIVLRPGQV